jgi:hypothetical protein
VHAAVGGADQRGRQMLLLMAVFYSFFFWCTE